MTRKICLLLTVLSLCLTSCKDDHKNLKDGLYAEIETPKGNILLQLEYTKAPITVANFVSLAEGTNPFVAADLKGKPFYDGTVFHRVEKDFVIQGGDPYGNGSGDPGYMFKDEITELKHNKAGTVAMANSGPNTNGCQFYITTIPTPNLDGGYNVFGYVVEGMDVVKKIDINDEMKQVTIIRKGEDAKKFDAVKVFSDYYKSYKPINVKKAEFFSDAKKSMTTTSSGVAYKITQTSTGEKPKKDTQLYIDYAGYLEDGTLFDTSNPEVAKENNKLNPERLAQNGYTLLPFKLGANKAVPGFAEAIGYLKIGEKAIIFIPANLGYGEQGAGNVIPPNSNLYFEIEVKDKP
ncbi:MAG: peptidylprolyl isomerase [Flavobacterium sp.]